MFDHISFPVSDMAATRTFYTTALTTLCIGVAIELQGAVAFGKSGRPQLRFSRWASPSNAVHLAFIAANRAEAPAVNAAAMAAGACTNGGPELTSELSSESLRRVTI